MLEGGKGGAYKPYFTPDGSKLVGVQRESRDVNIIDAKNLHGKQTCSRGQRSMACGVRRGKTLLVANHGDGTVSVIDLKEGRVGEDVHRGQRPSRRLTYTEFPGSSATARKAAPFGGRLRARSTFTTKVGDRLGHLSLNQCGVAGITIRSPLGEVLGFAAFDAGCEHLAGDPSACRRRRSRGNDGALADPVT